MSFSFQLLGQSRSPHGNNARAGRIHTPNGAAETPCFMPVATQGSVRGQTLEGLSGSGSQILLANSYHLANRPGVKEIARFGGVQQWCGWRGPMLTDSGGFQVFSLSHSRRISDECVEFRPFFSHEIDTAGSALPLVRLTPEEAIQKQIQIGADMIMVLDHCPPSRSSFDETADACRRTTLWANRCLEEFTRHNQRQALFGIVQGALFDELRTSSLEDISSLPFDGFALGGLAVGDTFLERVKIFRRYAGLLPAEKPRYVMGIGTPQDLLEAIAAGVDMFDCILPTAIAQRGVAYSWNGKLQLRRLHFRDSAQSQEPIDVNCPCPTCKNHTLGFLHHLLKTEEILGWQLLGTHNLYFYHDLCKKARNAILTDQFENFYRSAINKISQASAEIPEDIQFKNDRLPPAKPERGPIRAHLEFDETASAVLTSHGAPNSEQKELLRFLKRGTALQEGLKISTDVLTQTLKLHRYFGLSAHEQRRLKDMIDKKVNN